MFISILLLTETSPAPFDPSFDYSWLFIKVVLAMILVCGGAYFGIKYLLPKTSFMRRGHNSQIEIIERFPLEPKKNLYILKVSTKTILIGTTDTSINCLLEFQGGEFDEIQS